MSDKTKSEPPIAMLARWQLYQKKDQIIAGDGAEVLQTWLDIK